MACSNDSEILGVSWRGYTRRILQQSIKFFFTHSWSLQGVQFVEPSPIGFISQIHTPLLECGFNNRRVVEICDAIKNSKTTVFSPTCLSICSFQGSRLLKNFRVVEAHRRFDFAGFWFDLSGFICELTIILWQTSFGISLDRPCQEIPVRQGSQSWYKVSPMALGKFSINIFLRSLLKKT